MKTNICFYLLLLTIIGSAHGNCAPMDTNLPPYSIAQLTNLLNAKIDPDLFSQQIAKWGVKLDVATVLTLSSNGVSETDLQQIEMVINSLSSKKLAGPVPASDDTNIVQAGQDVHIAQLAAMFKTGFSTTNIAAYIVQYGVKLDSTTISNLERAGISATNIQAIVQLNSSSSEMPQAIGESSQVASLNMNPLTNLDFSAITNLPIAATNAIMARTNLQIVAEYTERVATNLSILQTNSSANQAFKQITNNLQAISYGLGGYAANLQTNSPGTNSSWLVAFSSGAQFLDPYNISVPAGATNGPNGTLKNSGNSTVAYFEFDVLRHWAFAPTKYTMSSDDNYNRFPIYGFFASKFSKTKTNFDWDSLTPEFQFTLGFLLGNGANTTNLSYTAQTLAGSDIYGSLGAGLPLWRNDWENEPAGFSAQVSLWGSVGVTTASSFERVHANEFIGGALDIGLPTGIFCNTNVFTPGLMEARIGMGHLDFPSTTGNDNQVNLDGNGEPIFHEKWVPEGSANLLIPFGSYLYLNIAADVFLQNQIPDQWDVKVGATIPWTTLKTMLPFVK